MIQILGILVLLIFVAILVWGGDRILALAPQSKLIAVARIIAIVAISIWVLFLIASFFGVPTPWGPGYGQPYRHR